MGVCLSCLKGRKDPETEPLLFQEPEVEQETPKLRDLEAAVAYVSDNFVDIANLSAPTDAATPLSEPRPPLQLDFEQRWKWPELGPLGEQDEQTLDDAYSTLQSRQLSVDTSGLSIEVS